MSVSKRPSNSANRSTFSSNSSTKGKRYILKVLNAKKKREIDREKARAISREYYDLRVSSVSQGSNTTSRRTPVSNRIMPCNTTKVVKQAPDTPPRNNSRVPPRYISPRKDNYIDDYAINKVDSKSPRKVEVKTKSGKDTGKSGAKRSLAVSRSGGTHNGLTPRDEYMVTKLYDNEIIYLKPSEVRFTHDQITAHFSDGGTLLSTFVALLYEKKCIKLGGTDVPPIEVMQTDDFEQGKGGKLWYVVNGNRRLFVFRRLERCGALATMQVIARKYDAIEIDKHFLTRNRGKSVYVTNDATLNAKMGHETKRWKDWKGKQPKQKGKKKTGSNSSCCCCIS